jgi:hypothetical protein
MQDEKITKLWYDGGVFQHGAAGDFRAVAFTCPGRNYSLELLLKIIKLWYKFSVYYYGFV